jgi:hypothetical protein
VQAALADEAVEADAEVREVLLDHVEEHRAGERAAALDRLLGGQRQEGLALLGAQPLRDVDQVLAGVPALRATARRARTPAGSAPTSTRRAGPSVGRSR